LDSHYRVRADHGALATLDTGFRIPHRNFERDVTLLPFGGPGRISAVGGESAHGNQVAVASIYGAEHIALILVRLRGKRWRNFDLAACRLWNGHLKETAQGLIYSVQILLDDFFTLLAVGNADRLANGLYRLLPRQHLGNGKEAYLHDGIHAGPHAGFARDFIGIDYVKLCFLRDQLFLYAPGQAIPDLIGSEWAIQQEDPTRHERLEHVIALQEYPLMASDEVRFR